MAGLIKTVVRVGVVTAVIATASVVIAGPHRAEAILDQARAGIMTVIDENIDDPVALRAQLRELESEYPKRIGQVRSDLAELHEQIRQLHREQAVAERVVVLADADLESLEPLLADGEKTRVNHAGFTNVTFANKRMSLDQAYVRANQIAQTRIAYANRASDAQHDLGYLDQQAGRLEELLMSLETERSQFQAQIWQLERQVDAIARNDRLIDLMEDRKRTIDDCTRYEVGSLDQLHGRLAEVRSRQEAELEYLAGDHQRVGYEAMAKMQLDGESPVGLPDVEAAPAGPKLRAQITARQ
jgi:chromosome segregation ATPase